MCFFKFLAKSIESDTAWLPIIGMWVYFSFFFFLFFTLAWNPMRFPYGSPKGYYPGFPIIAITVMHFLDEDQSLPMNNEAFCLVSFFACAFFLTSFVAPCFPLQSPKAVHLTRTNYNSAAQWSLKKSMKYTLRRDITGGFIRNMCEGHRFLAQAEQFVTWMLRSVINNVSERRVTILKKFFKDNQVVKTLPCLAIFNPVWIMIFVFY